VFVFLFQFAKNVLRFRITLSVSPNGIRIATLARLYAQVWSLPKSSALIESQEQLSFAITRSARSKNATRDSNDLILLSIFISPLFVFPEKENA
jgi:hypothetical protein